MMLRSVFGFLLGSFLAGAGLYYYVIDEYKVSNELLTEDIYVCFPQSLIHPSLTGVLDRLYKRRCSG